MEREEETAKGGEGRSAVVGKKASDPTHGDSGNETGGGREGGRLGRARGGNLVRSSVCFNAVRKVSLPDPQTVVVPPSLPSFIAQRLLKQNCLGSVPGILFARLCFCKTVLAYHSFCDTFLHLLLANFSPNLPNSVI